VIRQRGVVYDVGRSMGSRSMNWRPDYTPALMRRELDIIRTGLHANAVRLGGRDPLPQRASRGMRTWASGVPQPVTGSQPGPVW